MVLFECDNGLVKTKRGIMSTYPR